MLPSVPERFTRWAKQDAPMAAGRKCRLTVKSHRDTVDLRIHSQDIQPVDNGSDKHSRYPESV